MTAPLRAIRGIVFDLDGTLVDSFDDIAGHLNAALVDAGLPTRTHAEIRGWIGSGAGHLVAEAAGHSARAVDVLARYRAHYLAAPFGRTCVFAGLPAVLDAQVASGRVLGVLSNKPHELVVPIADQLLAAWPFRVVIGERVGRPRKPDPEAVLPLLAELGLAPAQCAFVGDSEIDVATARAAGMPGIAVTWGLRDPTALASIGPDFLVATPAELAALFG